MKEKIKKYLGWKEAKNICTRLSWDGKSLADTAVHIWRLPSVDEAVRSMHRHSRNCGGIWYKDAENAVYDTIPDKEFPLWDPCSPVIYYWTATEKNRDTAYIIVYNGEVWPQRKSSKQGSLGFRAVKKSEGNK